ncbi:hypothetical protein BH20ACT5_BH20ACT5_06630 [soil metagenome]
MAPKLPKLGRRAGKDKSHQIEPTWYSSDDGHPPLTELLAENQGALSPFGEDTVFPLPVSAINYVHPTDKPNRAENN